MTDIRTPPQFYTLVLMTALAVLTLNMIVPSLPAISEEFAAPYATVNLAIGGYLAMTALVQIIAGPLSDRLGRRPTILAALIIFVIASALCLIATDIRVFLTARMMQAAVIACSAMSLAVIRDTTPGTEAAARIATLSMAMAVAPMLGPLLGGVLEETLGWRAGFLLYSVAGIAIFILVWRDLGETHTRSGGGFAEMTQGIGHLIRIPQYWGYVTVSVFSTGAFFIFLAGAPLIASTVFDLSPAAMGVVVGSITAGFFAGSFISSRLSTSVGIHAMMIAGRLVPIIGLLVGLALYLGGIVSLPTFFGATITVGFGNGLTLPSSQAGVLSVHPELVGSAAGLSGAMVVAGGAALSTITGLLLTPEKAAPLLLLLVFLLVACLIGLSAAIWLWRDAARN